ncbi:endonuclease/exonuclease/phosphatase family protein [Actinophytocola glycyrrhizae]|uniref:Endonuclease/exonuclease/phosphatase family protein n=1 Tax=Actinophytocola glycyrrhizae TaxID=2044873 RepID=A0ABV9S4E4_9PSEU
MGRRNQTAEKAGYEPADDVAQPGPRRRRTVTFLLAVLALALIGYGVVRVLSLENNAFLVGAMALTPYVVAFAVLLTFVTLLLRRWVIGLAVLVVTLSMSSLLGPRYLAEEQPLAEGPHLRIMAANLYRGQADARALVDLVRRNEVDILTMPELTPTAVSALDGAGLANLLPYRVFDERPGGDGSGIASRLPLRQIVLVEESTLSQPSAVVDLPGNDDIEVTAVHVRPPLTDSTTRTWRAELADLPESTPDKRPRILAGDFNATFDHVAFRDLVDRGYADAGEETGEGLLATWSSWPTGPPLTLDHIVTDTRCAISSYAVFDLPNSDHRAVMAEVILP